MWTRIQIRLGDYFEYRRGKMIKYFVKVMKISRRKQRGIDLEAEVCVCLWGGGGRDVESVIGVRL